MASISNRSREFQPLYRHRQIYNLDILGMPCHRTDKPFVKGQLIMSALKQVEFNGSTGLVKFDSYGRRTDTTVHVFQQVREGILQKVGKWSDVTGLINYPNIRPKLNISTLDSETFNETFIISTVVVDPYVMIKKDKKLTGNARYEGYAVDLVYKLAEIIGFNFTLVPVADGEHGKRRPNGTWSGTIGELIAGVIDWHI
ncbi:GRIA1 [Bugula neritina]|uniref:GRIA1 n=1 Tax=Bugula neritina TaxID=10212 RepID=A0A7J7KQJ8_BUGNE|nr:GRIA1 [Bugula neritina]